MKRCWEIDINGYPIVLLQSDGGFYFTVQYGMEFHHDLPYVDAAHELGKAIMHALACESLIKDRGEVSA